MDSGDRMPDSRKRPIAIFVFFAGIGYPASGIYYEKRREH